MNFCPQRLLRGLRVPRDAPTPGRGAWRLLAACGGGAWRLVAAPGAKWRRRGGGAWRQAAALGGGGAWRLVVAAPGAWRRLWVVAAPGAWWWRLAPSGAQNTYSKFAPGLRPWAPLPLLGGPSIPRVKPSLWVAIPSTC